MRHNSLPLLAAVALATTPAETQQIPAGARFELELIEPVSSVRERFRSLMAALRIEGRVARCSTMPGEAPCIQTPERLRWLRPPFPVRRENRDEDGLFLPDDREFTYDPVFAWGPLELTQGGSDSLRGWLEFTKTGKPTKCDETTCEFIVLGLAGPWSSVRSGSLVRRADGQRLPDTDRQGEAIASCHVDRIEDAIGALKNCQQLALVAGDTIWVTVLAGFEPHVARLPMLGPGDPDVQFHLGGSIPNPDSVIAEAAQALADRPLELRTRIRPSRVSGYASYRASALLPKPPVYREIIEVRVHVDRVRNRLEISADIDLSVNPQNTTRPEDWHLSSPAQLLAYADSLRTRLRAVIVRLCPTAQWRDSETVTCR